MLAHKVVMAAPLPPAANPVAAGSDPQPSPLDTLMDKASLALVRCDYFTAEELCLRALERCRRAKDWERLARATLPLQEARRQIRQIAADTGRVSTLRSLPSRGVAFDPGCYLIEPPMIGLDARTFRELARGRKVPVIAIAKEPTTSAGKWPIVGVGTCLGAAPVPAVVRVQVDPPANNTPDAAWFQSTQEKLGDAAIAKVEEGRKQGWPADHRVEDLLEYLEAVPDHEKLLQALEATAREAVTAEPSTRPRRRGLLDDPRSF